jgi:surface carbohydrate biosynthesis protein
MSRPKAGAAAARPRVAVLVDDKRRDLPVAALMAHHLDRLGVDCVLEPLEAYRAVLGAYRPHMILFNHLNGSHLVAYSKRLAAMGVLTAVLPNEGISYEPDTLRYNALKHHSGAHFDYFFCWNEPHRQALLEADLGAGVHVEAVGVPRFDFYFKPWSRIVHAAPAPARPRGRPRLLLATNFALARFWTLPKAQADKLFAGWKDRIPVYRDYWTAVEASFNASHRVLEFAAALAATERYELVLRPHPREDAERYAAWAAQLPAQQRKWLRVDATTNITSLILDCDLELSCETCTTALESWVAGKPTIELEFERNPLLFHREHAVANTLCDTPAALPALVDRILREGENPATLAARRQHLQKWCDSPAGRSTERVATLIAAALHAAPAPDWSGLKLADARRAHKLRLLRNLGLAYHFDPLMPVKLRVNYGRYAIKNYAYQKSIKPRDVAEARKRMGKALAGA